MTKKILNEVEQFGAWNRQLKTLLIEAEIKDIDPEAVEPEKNNPAADKFKKSATDLGYDLYAISAWNYPQAWDDAEPGNDSAFDLIDKLAESLDTDASDYLKLTGQDIIANRMLAVCIYDNLNKSMFFMYADINRVKTNPKNIKLNPDQKREMESIFDLAVTWSNSLPADYNYKYDVVGKDEDWQDSEDELLGALSLKRLPAAKSEIPWKQLGPATVGKIYTDDVLKKEFENNPEGLERFMKRRNELALKVAELRKSQGVGRQKR